VGTSIIVLGLFYFSTLDAITSNTGLIMRMILLGIGLGSTMPIFTLAVQSAFAKERLGEVTAGTQLFRNVGGTVGTAILGGIMNSQLTKQMDNLQSDPFIAEVKQFDIGYTASHFDGSFIQSVLNRDNQQHIRDMLEKIPASYRTNTTADFNRFVNAAKVSFSEAIDKVFLVAGFLMVVALVIVFFLPEVPLRKSDRPSIEEAGVLLEDELGQSDEDCQPRVQAAERERL
jgi:MFS family permease